MLCSHLLPSHPLVGGVRTHMLVSHRDKATFTAHRSYLWTRGRCCSHVIPATLPPKTEGGRGWTKPLDCAPRNHRNARRSPKLDFKIESLPCPKVMVTSDAGFAAQNARQRRTRDRDFARYFRGKKPRDSLPEIVMSNRRFLDFPFINPKPHNFRPVSE